MKFLFDANLSPRLVPATNDLWPGSVHVRDFGSLASDDRRIWDFARAARFTIVSKDADFQQLSILYGAPPKVIWLRVGNAGTNAIGRLLLASAHWIVDFSRDEDAALLVL